MIFTLSPIRMDATLDASVSGDILLLNGETYDFGPLPEGASVPKAAIASDWIAGEVRREAGNLHVTLIWPHGADAPQSALFPETLTVKKGLVQLPSTEKGGDA